MSAAVFSLQHCQIKGMEFLHTTKIGCDCPQSVAAWLNKHPAEVTTTREGGRTFWRETETHQPHKHKHTYTRHLLLCHFLDFANFQWNLMRPWHFDKKKIQVVFLLKPKLKWFLHILSLAVAPKNQKSFLAQVWLSKLLLPLSNWTPSQSETGKIFFFAYTWPSTAQQLSGCLLTPLGQTNGAEADGHDASNVHRSAPGFHFHVPIWEAAASEDPPAGERGTRGTGWYSST